MKLALFALALLLTLAACAPEATPTPSPAARPGVSSGPATDAPTGNPPFIESSPAAQALRARAEAYSLARTEARFDDT